MNKYISQEKSMAFAIQIVYFFDVRQSSSEIRNPKSEL